MILDFLAGRDAHPRKRATPAFCRECEGCKPVRRVRESNQKTLRNEGTAHEVTTVGKVRSSIAVHSLEPVGHDQ